MVKVHCVVELLKLNCRSEDLIVSGHFLITMRSNTLPRMLLKVNYTPIIFGVAQRFSCVLGMGMIVEFLKASGKYECVSIAVNKTARCSSKYTVPCIK
jgi:hypothetical protein